jgi:hypothetical protein
VEESMLIIGDGAQFGILTVDRKNLRVEASSKSSMYKNWVV